LDNNISPRFAATASSPERETLSLRAEIRDQTLTGCVSGREQLVDKPLCFLYHGALIGSFAHGDFV
jgi:hypothetical protein